MEEIRYQYMRPAQVIARRTACPVAYIPLGNLEWHGPQNPLGADTIQAEALAVRAAELGGGIVMPPLYYGDNRSQMIQEAKECFREGIAGEMKLDAERFRPEFYPYSASEQARNYQNLLIHILSEMEALGFRVAVLVAGHYPLVDCARAAALEYNLWARHQRPEDSMLAYAAVDVQFCADKYPNAGDHGCCWETSHLLHICPDCVEMDALPKEEGDIIGLAGAVPPQRATAEFGKEILEHAARGLVREVKDRLEHRERYAAVGHWLDEGRWKEKEDGTSEL